MSVLRIHPRDNVAVALSPVAAGERAVYAVGQAVTALEEIPQGHKLALAPIAAGEAVIKYGYPIGRAKTDIAPGAWVHTHNLGTGLSQGVTAAAEVDASAPAPLPPARSGDTAAPTQAWACATRSGSCPQWAASTAWPRLWPGRRSPMPGGGWTAYTPGPIPTAVPRWGTTRRIPGGSSAA